MHRLTTRQMLLGTALIALAMGSYISWSDSKGIWVAVLTGIVAGAIGYSVGTHTTAKVILGTATFVIVSWIGLAIALFLPPELVVAPVVVGVVGLGVLYGSLLQP